ncbi:unnamed protein product [Tetraodon nigroviridis]|uniref:(spotted green pufferfish) hypothetical protein n=1 Tax=Tetraodon nigroviridis TaxID=99883 RepID=Q4RNI2_TETNG|nr:unnamed protein product [Tetraodon nigroviridis]
MSRLLLLLGTLGTLGTLGGAVQDLAPPTNLRFDSVDYKNVLSWSPPANGSSLLYDVQWKMSSSWWTPVSAQAHAAPQTQAEVLRPGPDPDPPPGQEQRSQPPHLCLHPLTRPAPAPPAQDGGHRCWVCCCFQHVASKDQRSTRRRELCPAHVSFS